MIQIENKPTVKSSGITEIASFGIKASGISHIFHILRNQPYSDKETAVLREYATNAADAHVEAGTPDKPIQISLPSRFNLELKVRDFGPSLDEQEIKDIFAFYGESTKRNTNNQTGMLGIGSKSAFAYGDNFVINAYIDGKRTTYNAFIDDSKVGCIAKLSTELTDEANGLEIVIPVKSQDVDDFRNKAKDVFEHFRTPVLIGGKDSREFFSYQEDEIAYEGKGWAWSSNRDKYKKAVAVMGNIGYPIDAGLLKDLGDSLSDFTCGNLTLECPIGELEISASREGLQYSDYTIKNLTNKITLAAKEMAKKLEASFDECDSLWQAKVLSHEVFDYYGSLHSAKRVLKKNINWKGKDIGDTSVSVNVWENSKKIDGKNLDELVEVTEYEKGYRGHQKVRAGVASSISATGKSFIIVNHESHRRGALKRIVPIKEEQGKRPYLITFRKGVGEFTKEKVLKHLGFCDDDYTVLDTLPEVVLSSIYGASNRTSGSRCKKSGQSVFVYNGQTHWTPQSANWDSISVDLDNEKVVYVEIDRFEYKTVDGTNRGSRRLNSVIDNAKKLNIDLKIIGVKHKQLKKFQDSDNATNLWDFIREELQNIIETLDLGEVNARYERTRELDSGTRTFCEAFTKYNFGDNSLGDLISEHKKATEDYKVYQKKLGAINTFAEDVGMTIKTAKVKVDVVQLNGAAMKLYPMLTSVVEQMTHWNWRSHMSDSEKQKLKKDVSNYVNLVNNSAAV